MLKLDLNLLWTVVDVLILYVLLRKFLFKPIQNVLDQRQKTIEADIAAAQTSKTEAAAALTTAQDKLRNVDNEAAARREAYEKQAEVEKQQLLADAQKQADEIVAAGKAAVEIERQNKLREADAQATALARSMCEKLLKNVRVKDKRTALDNEAVQKAIEQTAEELGSDGRILVRESGTEPVIRVMVEAASDEICEKYVDGVVKIFEQEGLCE